jgi:hypothetical protein
MPVLQRFGTVTARMYADDHRPPHIHIVSPDFQVLVRISDLSVIAGEARPGANRRSSGLGENPS